LVSGADGCAHPRRATLGSPPIRSSLRRASSSPRLRSGISCRQCRSRAGRLLRGEKPAELPIQTTSKGELVINRKTAKALGLDMPEKLLALATEVIVPKSRGMSTGGLLPRYCSGLL